MSQALQSKRSGPRIELSDEAEVRMRLAEIGLSPRTGWYSAIVLYALAAMPAVVLSILEPAQFSRAVLWFGLLAFLFSGLSVVALKYFPDSASGSHVRLCTGLAIISIAYLSVDDARQGFVLLPLAIILAPAIYHGIRLSVIYTFIACTSVAISILYLNEPWAVGMAISTTAALAIAATSMVIAQMSTRHLATTHRDLAYSDALTGLANTRELHKVLADRLPQAIRADVPLALFAIDLDDFKLVNDTLGHSIGDTVLQQVARGIELAAEQDDLVARRGGDEFSLLVIDATSADLDRLRVRIHEQICMARHQVCPGLTQTGSVAYVLSEADDSVGSILERADIALHDVKLEFHLHDEPGAQLRQSVLDQRLESERASLERAADLTLLDRRGADRMSDEDWERSKLRSSSPHVARPIWSFAAGIQIAMAAVIVAVVAFGIEGSFDSSGMLLAAGVLAVVALTSVLGALFELRRGLIHVGFIAAAATTVFAIHAAGPAGAAMLDLLLIPALCAFHFFDARIATVYLLAAIGAYAYLAISGSFPFAVARVAMFTVMAISAAAMIGKVRSITARYIVENWEFSQRDGLTGAANVRALRSRLNDVTTRVSAGKTTLATIAIDLDEFKQVNDHFSHSVGDATVASVARAIRDNVREDDLVARRGGDEFFVLIEHLDDKSISDTAVRIAESISRSRKRISPGLVSTASVAWTRCDSGDNADDVMRKADLVLHDQKIVSRERRSAAAA